MRSENVSLQEQFEKERLQSSLVNQKLESVHSELTALKKVSGDDEVDDENERQNLLEQIEELKAKIDEQSATVSQSNEDKEHARIELGKYIDISNSLKEEKQVLSN